jgi:hypothetical protein
MGLTNGQNTVLKSDTRMKASFSGLSPQRQVRAIRMWMNANNKTKGSELETWPAKKDEEVRSHIVNIADYLGIDVGHPDFRRELRSVRSGHEYKTISGEFGTVPAEIVEAVCETYKIKEGVIREAVNVWPAPSARGDFHLALISLLQRIRSRASNPAKMEIRAA